MQTIIDILHQRASMTPNAVAYRFIKGADLTASELRYGELWSLVLRLAYSLEERGLRGKQAMLICKSQQNFVISFFACLTAGVVAVPTALPRRKALIGRLQLLLDDAQVSAILCDANEVQALVTEDGLVVYFDLQSWMDEQERGIECNIDSLHIPQVTADAIAFLQYTSGSTGDPKGVMVTHGNLMSNSAIIQRAMVISDASTIFTALPLFHDMGLVGGVLQPMYAGCVGHCMSPSEFVQYPERWLQIMSKFKITISGGPNFMYDLAARSIESAQVTDCDLSYWKLAFCGAEPIRADTIQLFSARFAGLGFKADIFYPCYGMAESTLFITGKADGMSLSIRGHQGGQIVGCGVTHDDTQVIIVDPETRSALPEASVGEIWVRGSSVASGYWQRPELSVATFQARMVGNDTNTYLRTGDLGFLHNAELYITARLKDLIIMYGKKYAPQDIEADAEASHVALCERGGAAFSIIRNGVDCVVLVCELQRVWLRRHEEWPLVVSAIRAAISVAHGLVLDDIVFIKPTTLPRTSSGKVRRGQCRSDYLNGNLERVQSLNTLVDLSTVHSTTSQHSVAVKSLEKYCE